MNHAKKFLKQFEVLSSVLLCRQAFSYLDVVKVQQCVALTNEIMNVKSWMVLKWNHCY